MSTNLLPAIAESIRKNWKRPALSDLNGTTLTYGALAAQIGKMHLIFRAAGLKPGDKVMEMYLAAASAPVRRVASRALSR